MNELENAKSSLNEIIFIPDLIRLISMHLSYKNQDQTKEKGIRSLKN